MPGAQSTLRNVIRLAIRANPHQFEQYKDSKNWELRNEHCKEIITKKGMEFRGVLSWIISIAAEPHEGRRIIWLGEIVLQQCGVMDEWGIG